MSVSDAVPFTAFMICCANIDAACLLSSRRTVTATASTKDKLDWLLSIPNGATHAVNYKTEDFAAEVKKTTDGKGVDVVIDFVGQTHWTKNIDSLALDGRMTMLGLLGGKLVTFSFRETRNETRLFQKEARFLRSI